MKLHENNELFNNAIISTAQQKNISEIYIEKDYWVTVALYTIFNSAMGSQAIFKGGTALSKCYNIIERFSEDIDIVILKNRDESGNFLKNKLKKISDVLSLILPEIEVEGITNKKGMNRKTAHTYPINFKREFGQVRKNIILETTWLGSSKPYATALVDCFIAKMMENNNQLALIEEYNLSPFHVKVLCKERTLCEKIMSLIRFSFSEDPITDLRNKIRHIYDIHMMLLDNATNNFFYSENFEKMFLKVASDDNISYKKKNKWLKNHPSNAIIFSHTYNTWKKIRNTYFTTFSELVYGVLPQEEEILKTLKEIKIKLENLNWIF